MAHLTVVSGVVQVSDGIRDVTALDGDFSIRNVRALLLTDTGIADLSLWDGSFVVIDSGSIIEINRYIEKNVGGICF